MRVTVRTVPAVFRVAHQLFAFFATNVSGPGLHHLPSRLANSLASGPQGASSILLRTVAMRGKRATPHVSTFAPCKDRSRTYAQSLHDGAGAVIYLPSLGEKRRPSGPHKSLGTRAMLQETSYPTATLTFPQIGRCLIPRTKHGTSLWTKCTQSLHSRFSLGAVMLWLPEKTKIQQEQRRPLLPQFWGALESGGLSRPSSH